MDAPVLHCYQQIKPMLIDAEKDFPQLPVSSSTSQQCRLAKSLKLEAADGLKENIKPLHGIFLMFQKRNGSGNDLCANHVCTSEDGKTLPVRAAG